MCGHPGVRATRAVTWIAKSRPFAPVMTRCVSVSGKCPLRRTQILVFSVYSDLHIPLLTQTTSEEMRPHHVLFLFIRVRHAFLPEALKTSPLDWPFPLNTLSVSIMAETVGQIMIAHERLTTHQHHIWLQNVRSSRKQICVCIKSLRPRCGFSLY